MSVNNLALNEQIQQLQNFIAQNPDPRELKRALAVKLALSGYAYRVIQEILGVSVGFISKWNNQFSGRGIEGLKLAYKGRKSYLTDEKKQEVIAWIISQKCYNVAELEWHLSERYNVEFKSRQSYYKLLNEAQMSLTKSSKFKFQTRSKIEPEGLLC